MQISTVSNTNSPQFTANTQSQARGTGSTQRSRSGSALDPVQAVAKSQQELSQQEQQEVRKLKARDREVRAHEQAHKAAAGGLVRGGATYEYTTGPDGKQYAVAGEVKIDTSPVRGNPDATIRKAQQIQRAATAPADPSPQDLQVAAQAINLQLQARLEKSRQEQEEAAEADSSTLTGNASGTAIAGTESEEGAEGNRALEDSESNGDTRCAICGGQHSAESHSGTNTQRLNQAFELISRAGSSGFNLVV